jgi:hypothetical protein
LAAEVRKVEAETGPLKYIAAIIYGNNPDANLLESAVRWVIILIVVVFDPLALVLLLAAQQSFRWDREREEQEKLDKQRTDEKIERDFEEAVEKSKLLARELDRDLEQRNIDEANALLAEVERKVPEVIISSPDVDLIAEANAKIAEIERPEPEFVVPHEPIASDPVINCLKCDTELVNVTGIGSFCPNKECGVVEESPVTIEKPVEVIVPGVEEVRVSSDEITVDSVIAPSVEPPLTYKTNIITENVTTEKVLYHPNQGHITFEGKRMSVENLKSIRPDLVAPLSGIIPNRIDFGSEFPASSLSGDTFIRIDVIPHRVYKFNGRKWMAVDKTENTTYLTSLPYLRYLIEKIEKNEYDPELLTYTEQDEIESYLVNKKK